MINRRDFIKFSLSAAFAASLPAAAEAFTGFSAREPRLIRDFSDNSENVLGSREYFEKIKNFNHAFSDDMQAGPQELALIKSCLKKSNRLMRYVGFGNFNILNFDEALRYTQNTSALAPFTRDEISYMELLFHRDAREYGFYGEKVLTNITDRVNSSEMVKIPRSGHYIYKLSLPTYKKITDEIGSLILTSGVRSVMKQFNLFLSKAVETRGNLSMASRSIAPVGYSYHGIGDFDVGIKGWGYENFTDKFATTKEYQMLMHRGYMRIRYDRRNPYGVRFEPWHVKVV